MERGEPLRGLAERIEGILRGPVIEKPERHRSPPGGDADVLSVRLVGREEALTIADVFLDLEAASVNDAGEISGLGGHHGDLSDAWLRYADSLRTAAGT
jgi:hypothetical protein